MIILLFFLSFFSQLVCSQGFSLKETSKKNDNYDKNIYGPIINNALNNFLSKDPDREELKKKILEEFENRGLISIKSLKNEFNSPEYLKKNIIFYLESFKIAISEGLIRKKIIEFFNFFTILNRKKNKLPCDTRIREKNFYARLLSFQKINIFWRIWQKRLDFRLPEWILKNKKKEYSLEGYFNLKFNLIKNMLKRVYHPYLLYIFGKHKYTDQCKGITRMLRDSNTTSPSKRDLKKNRIRYGNGTSKKTRHLPKPVSSKEIKNKFRNQGSIPIV